MSLVEINALLALITGLLPAGVTIVEDIKTLFAKNPALTQTQLTALIALVGAQIQAAATTGIAGATADLGTTTGKP